MLFSQSWGQRYTFHQTKEEFGHKSENAENESLQMQPIALLYDSTH